MFSSKVLDEKLNELQIYGYTTIAGMISPDHVENCLEQIKRFYDSESKRLFPDRAKLDNQDRIVYNLQNKGKLFIDILGHPLLNAILMEKLNDPFYKYLPANVPNYILSYYNARSSGAALPLHTDTFIPSTGERTWTVQAAIMLEDSCHKNGCTTLVPGSHISGRFVDRRLEKVEEVVAKAGDVVVWDSRIWHGTTENTTSNSRWSMIATFSCWWVKQRVDITRGLPDSIYSQLTDEQKVLMGYCSIPPLNEEHRLNFKCGYEDFRSTVDEYYPERSRLHNAASGFTE